MSCLRSLKVVCCANQLIVSYIMHAGCSCLPVRWCHGVSDVLLAVKKKAAVTNV